ncbi:NgoPII family restriction endonuclease [Aquimarina sp. SS2-1]|uniref:NgoPII family restriction endonuclease n=1 Tax=Aquimarina besae TaxID=3342247 RepID=UPI00366B1E4A
MTNIIQAIINLINNPIVKIKDYYEGRNRANSVGGALEVYIKDIFANTVGKSEAESLIEYNKCFSYLGNQNNPPDLMIKGGDAIEVKKIQSPGTALALNSSYPKAKLYSDSPMITKACRECENWKEKDIIYAVGYTTDDSINWLWLVYGSCYAAEKETYERIKKKIKEGIIEIGDVEFAETKELGKVKKVDPLGITDLRIRGMWHITNPNKVFSYINDNDEADFKLRVLMPLEKYNSFPENDRKTLEGFKNLSIEELKIKNPNNVADLIEAKFIKFNV